MNRDYALKKLRELRFSLKTSHRGVQRTRPTRLPNAFRPSPATRLPRHPAILEYTNCRLGFAAFCQGSTFSVAFIIFCFARGVAFHENSNLLGQETTSNRVDRNRRKQRTDEGLKRARNAASAVESSISVVANVASARTQIGIRDTQQVGTTRKQEALFHSITRSWSTYRRKKREVYHALPA